MWRALFGYSVGRDSIADTERRRAVGDHTQGVPADQAMARLLEGNRRYVAEGGGGDVSAEVRVRTALSGQRPYAIVVTCSDSRVIPEVIFSAGIGELFVIRVAGNVIDDHQLGSIEYAASHLGCNLVLVLGHDHCGAVDAAMNHDPDGYIKSITDEICQAIGDADTDDLACRRNALHSAAVIEGSLEIQREEETGLKVMCAFYHLETGMVELL